MLNEIINIICQACNNITSDYFKLKTAYEQLGIIRERVFCYELYHQMRLLQDPIHSFSLNGEIDKRGHIDFLPEDWKNPDFIFHMPGKHEGNEVVMEVKGTLDKQGINKDFHTLFNFVTKYYYKAGVFFLYNHTLSQLTNTLGDNLKGMKQLENSDRIFIITLPSEKNFEGLKQLTELEF